MTGEQIGSLLERYGLPLAGLFLVVWAITSRRYVTGSELKEVIARFEKQIVDLTAQFLERLKYADERRIEEREGRLAAEATLKVVVAALEKIGGGIDSLSSVVTDAVERAIEEDRRGR